MTSVSRGVLQGRGSGVVVFILFSWLGAWSWASVTSSHHLEHDPVYVGGLLFAIFITVSIAYRSPLQADRTAFGATAVAFLLATVAMTAPLDPPAMVLVRGAKSLMWTVTAVVGLVVSLRGSKNAQGNS